MFFALMVFLCGGLGAMTRFFLDKAMSPRLRTESSIISPVFVINLVGSFLYGLLIMPVSNPRALGVHYNATDQVAFWCTVITTGCCLAGILRRCSRRMSCTDGIGCSGLRGAPGAVQVFHSFA